MGGCAGIVEDWAALEGELAALRSRLTLPKGADPERARRMLRAVAEASKFDFVSLDVSGSGIVDRKNGATRFTEIEEPQRLHERGRAKISRTL